MYDVCIIGAGNKGAMADCKGSGNEHKYLSYAHAVTDHPLLNLVAIIDKDEETLTKAVFNWAATGYLHFEEFIKRRKADIYIVATPDMQHFNALAEIHKIATSKKNLVVCEKPLCVSYSNASEIVKIYNEKKIPLLVNYTRRFIPGFQCLKEMIAANKLGELVKGYLYFNGGWEHTASHFIDLVRFLGLEKYIEEIDFREIDVDFKWVFQWGFIFEKDTVTESISKNQISQMYDNNSMQLMDNVVNHLRNNEPLICTGKDALDSLKITKYLMHNQDYYNKIKD